MNIPDNYDLWEAHEREKERQLEKLPVCEVCGKPIQDEYLYLINDEFTCTDCLIRDFRKCVDDYVE